MPDENKDMTECISWIQEFSNGGLHAQYRLQQVISSIFRHYNITDQRDQAYALEKAGLSPVFRENKRRRDHQEVTFDLVYEM
jgi:hypothetical protein